MGKKEEEERKGKKKEREKGEKKEREEEERERRLNHKLKATISMILTIYEQYETI